MGRFKVCALAGKRFFLFIQPEPSETDRFDGRFPVINQEIKNRIFLHFKAFLNKQATNIIKFSPKSYLIL